MSLLVLGSTGTLGRQIVRRALDEGFQVKCFVRNFRKASFLKEWGAELVYGDLKVQETIPVTLYGITAIIDASTTRSSDFYFADIIDLESKKTLIQAAKLASIKKYVFFSIFNAQSYPDISLMNFKVHIENQLKSSKLDYTIFVLYGFFQGLIQQYAVPILDKQAIWITQESKPIPYIDTQDVAKITIKSLSLMETNQETFVLPGSYSWKSSEIIELCEKLAGQKSQIAIIPIFLLRFLRQITKLFQWSWSVSERLAFISVLTENLPISLNYKVLDKIFKMKENDLSKLEDYLEEYFSNILRKMKELNEQDESYSYTEEF